MKRINKKKLIKLLKLINKEYDMITKEDLLDLIEIYSNDYSIQKGNFIINKKGAKLPNCKKYYILTDGVLYKAKINNIKKLVGVAYNYNGDLYYLDDNEQFHYIYQYDEDNTINNKLLQEYNIELQLSNDYLKEMFIPFYIKQNSTKEDLFYKYGEIDITDIAKEV